MIYPLGNQKLIKTLLLFAKWFVLLITYFFLAYKLYNFEHYAALWQHFRNPDTTQYFWLFLVFILLPLNIFFEVIKWQTLVEKSEKISFKKALNAVLAGFSTGFVTPNRIGEMAGRMLYVLPENRKITAIYALLNSFTQNFVIALVGLPAALYYFFYTKNTDFVVTEWYFISITLFISVVTCIYFLIPCIVGFFIKKNRLLFLKDLTHYKTTDLLQIKAYSFLRLLVFSIQFFAMLQFFGVGITVAEAIIAIPTSYLFVTFTPSLAFSEAAIRSSYAVVFIGSFSDNIAGIAFAGFLLWLINYGIPMLLGSRILVNTK